MAFLLVASATGACSSNSSSGSPSGSSSKPSNVQPATKPNPDLTIFLTAEMKGSTEPCGCTSDPLGDLARTSELIRKARAEGPVLVFDGGSTLYTSAKVSEHARAQEAMKSKLIIKAFAEDLNVDAMGLGPYDFGEGKGAVQPARHAVNVAAESGVALAAPEVLDAGGIKVGVFGVASPNALAGLELEVSDAVPAATKAVEELKGRGAEVVVALAQMTKDEARDLAKNVSGMDFVLISQNLPEPDDVRSEPMRVGDSWLFGPANRGQVVSRLRLNRRGDGAFVDALGEVRAKDELATMETELADLRADLKKWQEDPSADKAFVAAKEAEVNELEERRSKLQASPLQVPETGNYFTLAQLRIHKGLDCQESLVAAKRAYDKASGLANVEAAKGKMPEPAAKGQASYVGSETCEMCHDSAFEFWQTTKHAQAWETIEVLGKEFNFDCIGCHVTGFDKPGGSNIAFNEALRDVQCEQCHGPGSLHVDAKKPAKKETIRRTPDESVCGQCHTPEHSDTFEFQAYLRDVTGPGHGAEFRKTLGDGPTGKGLRDAALAKAGLSIGKNCPK